MIAEALRRSELSQGSRWETYGPGLVTPLVEQHRDLVHVGKLDDFYRLTNRAQAMPAYKRIAKAGYARQAIHEELGDPLPYMLHMGMQDQLEL